MNPPLRPPPSSSQIQYNNSCSVFIINFTMSSATTLSLRYHLRTKPNATVSTDDQPSQLVELRLRRSSELVLTPSHQILQQTFPTLFSTALFPFPLGELENPPFLSYYSLHRFLSSSNTSVADSDAIFLKIVSFAHRLAAGGFDLNFHIIATIDLVYTHWVDLDPEILHPEEWAATVKGASEWVMERIMKEKYEGEEEMRDEECCVCYEKLHSDGDVEKEEVIKIPCGHLYHKFCILKWLNINNSCPLCRTELRD